MPADPTQSMSNPKDQKPLPSQSASAPSVPGASAEPTRAATGDVREALEEAVAREREARTEIERLTAAWKIDIAKREEAREAAGRAESALAERTRERDEARDALARLVEADHAALNAADDAQQEAERRATAAEERLETVTGALRESAMGWHSRHHGAWESCPVPVCARARAALAPPAMPATTREASVEVAGSAPKDPA